MIKMLLVPHHVEIDPLRPLPDDPNDGETAGLGIYERYATNLAEKVGAIALPKDDPRHPYFEVKPENLPSDPAKEKLRSHTFVTMGASAIMLWFTVDHGLVTPVGPRVVLHAEDLPEELPEDLLDESLGIAATRRYVLTVTPRNALMYAGTAPYHSGLPVVRYASQMVDMMADAYDHHARRQASAAVLQV
jgi:hypothetical protein